MDSNKKDKTTLALVGDLIDILSFDEQLYTIQASPKNNKSGF